VSLVDGLSFASLLRTFLLYCAVFINETVVQGAWLLAEQMYLVPGAYQGAAEVLDVDVAP
jgi:hypothetical protein